MMEIKTKDFKVVSEINFIAEVHLKGQGDILEFNSDLMQCITILTKNLPRKGPEGDTVDKVYNNAVLTFLVNMRNNLHKKAGV